MFPIKFVNRYILRNQKQITFIQRMRKKKAFRKMKTVVREINQKQKLFNALYVNALDKKLERNDKLHAKLKHIFHKQGLILPITITRWVYDQ